MPTTGKAFISSQTSPVLIKIYELLKPDGDRTSPGEWFSHEKIVQEAMTVVTPGQAVRSAETNRKHIAKKEGRSELKPRTKYRDDYDTQVAVGQRAVARERIWASAHIEFRLNPETGEKEIRFNPGMGRNTKKGQKARRMTGINKHNIPYKYRSEETSDRPEQPDGHGSTAVPGADAATDPQPEGG